MFAALFRQWWRKRAPGSIGQVEFFAADDLPPLGDGGRRAALVRAVDAGNRGHWERARRELQKAAIASPQLALPHALHGAVLEQTGAKAEADAAYATARRADGQPGGGQGVGEHFHALGRKYLRARKTAEAARCLLLAHRLMPTLVGPLEMLGVAGYQAGDVDAARRWLDLAIAHASDIERGALLVNRLVFTIPQIYRSGADLLSARERFERELEDLHASPPTLNDPSRAVDVTLFYLGFQGKNDKQINSRFAELLLKSCPQLTYTAAHVADPGRAAGGRPRVGFISAFLRDHSVGVWYRELVRMLIESGRFETVLFTVGTVDAELRDAANRHGKLVEVAVTVADAREQIGAEHLDMVVYTDVVLNRFLYCLAFSRLAPVQALLVGHPCTSGIPSLDFFISNVFQDGENAQAHYSEKLVRLPRIPVYVKKTPPPAKRLSRAELGLDAKRRYYICPMLLQKFHPDFDWAMAQILRSDAGGEIVLFEDPKQSQWRVDLEARLRRAIPDVAGRITFQPVAPLEVFLNLLLAADCLIDPFHFSGGVTTYIELSLGLPVVTLPGELFRSRMSAGIYAQAGVTDCVARDREHFVELAVALANDPARRAAISRKILDSHANIFETADAVDVLAEWMESTISAD